MNYQSKEFKKLQGEWYEKLKKEGFEDIEDGEYLRTWDSSYFWDVDKRQKNFDERQSYYYQLSHYLTEYAERPIFLIDYFSYQAWELHAEGLSLRCIAQELRTQGFKTNKDVVNKVINDLKSRLKVG
jgi:hypothetical protein